MKQTTKGFTLVELLVVIAILAILATVSVVGYTSFITKANISNDTVIARELTTLIQATDITDPVEDFDDVINVLYQNGFLLANLNTKTQGCFFVWESTNNQILLVDGQNNFEVIFPETHAPAGESWHLVCADKDLLAGLTLPQGVQIKRAAGTIDSLQEFIAEGGEIYIDESVVLTTDKKITVKDNAEEVVLNLGESTLSTNGVIEGKPILVHNSKLTIIGGVINGSGEATNENGTFNTAIGYDGGSTTLIVKDLTCIGITGINGTWDADGDVSITVENSSFDVTSSGIVLSAGAGTDASATITNCTINAGRYAIFTSQDGLITVNGGSYTSTGQAVLYAQDAGSVIVVNDGDFKGIISAVGGAQITINGGTFDSTFSASSSVILINGGTFTVNPQGLANVQIGAGKTVVDNGNGTWTVR